MLARPLFRERHRPDMSEEEATQLLHEGLRVGATVALDNKISSEAAQCQLCIANTVALYCGVLLQVCYYRDKQTTNKFQIAKVTAEGTTISDPFALETKWDYKVSVASVGQWKRVANAFSAQ